MASRLERWSYKQFKQALDRSYAEAIANITLDGTASVNWIKPDEIQAAYEAVWSTASYITGAKAKRAITGAANILEDQWKARTIEYMNRVAGYRVKEVWAESRKLYEKALNDAIVTAANEGAGIEATTRRVRQLVNEQLGGDINIWRARRIAQTEVISAGNYGTWEGMRDAVNNDGARILKQWRVGYTGKDPRHGTYPGLDGQIREVDKDFDVNGYQASYPGDPRLPAGESINCYCNSIAILNEGQVIT